MIEPRSTHRTLGSGIDYHLLEWDPGSHVDHTVFLIHGFLDLAWGWAAAVRAGLGERLHIIAPDMRGHGDSGHIGPGGYYHFMDYLADLHELVRALGRDRVSLVGHSMGGSITAYYAGAFPDAVHRLALLEGTGPPEMPGEVPDRVVSWLAGCERMQTRAPRSYADLAAAAARLSAHDPRLDPTLALEIAERCTRVNADGTRQFKHDPLHLTLGPYPFRLDVAESFWRRITCPVLLVEGAESSHVHPPEEAARRAAAFRDVRKAKLAGAAHMMQRHQPGALAALLAAFLGS